jgi:hypothetical protein
MIVFENDGEIDPQLIALIGVNVKESASAIGFFGTGLKYAVASMARWGEHMSVQSGLAEFAFTAEETEIRNRRFGVLIMRSRFDSLRLGFTTELGKQWEPWMVYRELWCNAHDEPNPRIYETDRAPSPKEGVTRVVVAGPKIETAHANRADVILDGRTPLHTVDGLEIHEGAGNWIFYRGIAVQKLDKPSLYTYNITQHLYLTEDRTAGSWQTDPIIARGLSEIENGNVIERTLTAPKESMESRLDYDYAHEPSEAWLDHAQAAAVHRPLDVPRSVRAKFEHRSVSVCPTCGRPTDD